MKQLGVMEVQKRGSQQRSPLARLRDLTQLPDLREEAPGWTHRPPQPVGLSHMALEGLVCKGRGLDEGHMSLGCFSYMERKILKINPESSFWLKYRFL